MDRPQARIFHTRTAPLINTGTLARCYDVPLTGELFQQFVTSPGKPLKRLTHPSTSLHRAEAPVLMRGCSNTCEISGLDLLETNHSASKAAPIRTFPHGSETVASHKRRPKSLLALARIFLLVGVFLACPAALFAREGSTNEASKVGRGFSYIHDEIPAIPWSIHIIKIDRSNPELELHTTLAKGTTYGLSPLTEQIKLLPPDSGRPVAAINGDFWNDNSDYKGDPKGLQVIEEELVSAPCDRTCFWIDAEGNPQMTNVVSRFFVTWPNGTATPFGLNEERPKNGAVLYTPTLGRSTRTSGGREFVLEPYGSGPWLPLRVGQNYTARVREIHDSGDTQLQPGLLVLSVGPQLLVEVSKVNPAMELKLSTSTWPDLSGVKTAIGGGPALVQNGKPLQWTGHQPRHPRTAIGCNEKYLFLVVVDGRQNELSVGMTFPELAAYMVKLGCDRAMNLDGGASATCWVLGQVMNSPSAGHERNMANALVLVQKERK